MDWEYAYNYWRKAFVEGCEGAFIKEDFDNWFRANSDPQTYHLGYFPVIDRPGSPEHFSSEMRQAFSSMLSACASGKFNA